MDDRDIDFWLLNLDTKEATAIYWAKYWRGNIFYLLDFTNLNTTVDWSLSHVTSFNQSQGTIFRSRVGSNSTLKELVVVSHVTSLDQSHSVLFQSRIVTLLWNKSLWLVVVSQWTSFNQPHHIGHNFRLELLLYKRFLEEIWKI